MSSFRVCTFNIGTGGVEAYLNTYNFHRKKDPKLPEAKGANSSFNQLFKDRYSQAQIQTSTLLNEKAHVYCLQGVGDSDRTILQFLKNKNFKPAHCGTLKKPDAFIFLDKRRFTITDDHSFIGSNGMDVAIAKALDLETNQKVIFVSARIPSFKVSDITNPDSIESGLNHCKEIANKLISLDLVPLP